MGNEVTPQQSTTAPVTEAPKAPEAAPVAPAANSTQATPPVENPVDNKPAEAASTEAKPGETKPEENKPEEPPKKVVPEKYDLKLSENSFLEASFVDEIATAAKVHGLSQEEAQALLAGEEQRVAAHVNAQANAWLAQSQGDSEIGGTKYLENAEHARRAIAHFGSDKLKQELDRFGYGNHPEVIRCFSKIGRALADDKLVTKTNSPGAPKSAAEVLYGGAQS